MAVALGLSNGAVHLLRADVPKSKVTAPVPAAQLRDAGGSGSGGTAGSAAGSPAGSPAGSGSGITALHFVSLPSAAAGAEAGSSSSAAPASRRGEAAAAPGLHIFAVGAARLAAFDARTGRRLLDDECGAAPGCSAVSCKGELMLAGPEAVYFYTGRRCMCIGSYAPQHRFEGALLHSTLHLLGHGDLPHSCPLAV